MQVPIVPWEKIATNDKFRQLERPQQTLIAQGWLNEMAPMMYPEMQADPKVRGEIQNFVREFRLPNKIEGEDEIIRPETLNIEDGVRKMERNDTFRRLSRDKQQQLRTVWYYKTLSTDEEFQQLSPEEQRAYYENLLSRPPGYSSQLARRGDRAGFFMPFDKEMDADLSVNWEEVIGAGNVVASNFLTRFGETASALVTGPLRFALGEDSALARFMADFQKEREWLNDTSQYNSLLTQTAPSLVGSLGGLIFGPYGKMSRGLAGGMKLAKTAKGTQAIQIAPGLLERVGTTATSKIPSFGYQVAGGATAGAMQGIATALQRNEDWDTYLATDATFGVGFEMVSRYLGALRMIKKAARSSGVEINKILRAPLQLGDTASTPPELAKILRTHPDMAPFINEIRGVDPNGLLLDWSDSFDGINAKARTIGLKARRVGQEITIEEPRPRGRPKILQRFNEGSDMQKLRKASAYLEMQEPRWEQFMRDKGLFDVASSQDVELRRSNFVPVKARRTLFNAMEGELGPDDMAAFEQRARTDYSLDPRGDTSDIDFIYNVIRKKTGPKARDALRSRYGIFANTPDKEANAQIKSIRQALREVAPEEPVVYMNRQTQNPVDPNFVPSSIIEDPSATEPFMNNGVFRGTPAQIRKLLSTITKRDQGTRVAEGKAVKGTGMQQIYRIPNSEAVDLVVKMPDATGGVQDMVMHFPTLKSAREFLTKGQTKGLRSAIEDIAGDDTAVKNSYKSFLKAYRRNDPEKFARDNLPFQFVARNAKRKGYQLGSYKGKYILQDFSAPPDQRRIVEFDNLGEVNTFVRSFSAQDVRPNLLGKAVSAEALETQGVELENPLRDVPYDEVKRTHRYGIFSDLKRKFYPTQYAVQDMEHLEATKYVQKMTGKTPTDMYRMVQDAHGANIAFETQHMDSIARLKKGLKKAHGDYITRWMEAVDDLSESHVIPGKFYETKDQVRAEMVREFGEQTTDRVIDAGIQLRRHFDALFSQMDIDPSMFLKHYMPHLRDVASMGDLGSTLRPRDIAHIPTVEKEKFFEMMREVDPRDVLMETDAFKLAEIYTHLAGRNLHMRPVLDTLKRDLDGMVKALRNNPEITNQDYEMVANYFGRMFDSMTGRAPEGQRTLEMGVEGTRRHLHQLAEKMTGRKIPANTAKDPISTLITISTGAHLAGRGYPIARNLTQSALTGAPLIGVDGWMDGIQRAMQPGSLQRLMDLGKIHKVQMPTGAGYAMDHRGIIAAGMKGYKWADWMNRAIVYLGAESNVERTFADLKAGRITRDQMLRRAGARMFGKSNYNNIVKSLNAAPTEDAALTALKDRVGTLAMERSQYLYNRFDQPEMFRSGIGRVFGQYTSWPLNYANFIRSSITSDSMGITDKAKVIGTTAGVAAAIAKGMHEVGLNPRNFMPWNMGVMSEGPYASLTIDMLRAINGDRQAYANAVNSLTSLAPFVYAGEGAWKAIQALDEGDLYEAFLQINSAPINYGLFQQRDTPLDSIREAMLKGGEKYFQLKHSVIGE